MKLEILREAHYVYNFDHELYFNREARKVFSFPFLDDHGEEELIRSIQECTAGGGWKFYFNFQPSDRVRQQLESLLNAGD
jgi:hypothetical protein